MNKHYHIPSWRPIRHVGGGAQAARWVSVLLLGLSQLSQAAPAEGTSGQTVTGRSVHLNRQERMAAAPPSRAVAAVAATSKPAWKSLSPEQQKALQPLAPHWDQLSAERKLKWLLIAKNYDKLPPQEQAKLHRGMSKWVSLSRQERAQARQNFEEIKGLTAEQKAAQWEAYQALSPEEKRKLASQTQHKSAGVATGKPVTPSKLTQVPVRRKPAFGTGMAEVSAPLQQHTLLPVPEPTRTETERSPYEDEPADAQ